MLAMAPIGIVTIIVSAIRVGGYPWLKAVVGRARENIAAAEIEFMSSTSKEACELSNGKSVVRCLGTADICEFVCIYPTGATDSPYITSVRIMDIEEATWPRGSYLRIRDKSESICTPNYLPASYNQLLRAYSHPPVRRREPDDVSGTCVQGPDSLVSVQDNSAFASF